MEVIQCKLHASALWRQDILQKYLKVPYPMLLIKKKIWLIFKLKDYKLDIYMTD